MGRREPRKRHRVEEAGSARASTAPEESWARGPGSGKASEVRSGDEGVRYFSGKMATVLWWRHLFPLSRHYPPHEKSWPEDPLDDRDPDDRASPDPTTSAAGDAGDGSQKMYDHTPDCQWLNDPFTEDSGHHDRRMRVLASDAHERGRNLLSNTVRKRKKYRKKPERSCDVEDRYRDLTTERDPVGKKMAAV